MVSYPRYSNATAARLFDENRALACADAAVEYPDYYGRHAHFLPGGYLSARGARWYGRLIAPLYYQFREAPVEDAAVRVLRGMKPRDVVELGCGPGVLLRRLAAGLREASVTGIDLSPRLLAAARAGGARVLHADAARTPLDDGAADVVIACHLLGHVPAGHCEGIVREAARLLRPGGRLVLVEHRWHAIHTPGLEVAGELGLPADAVYKTLVVEEDPPRGKPRLFLVPADSEVDLKRLAAALGVKKVRMASQRDAERQTRLKVGGISALALTARGFPVYIDARALELESILVSAGQRGADIRLAVSDLVAAIRPTALNGCTRPVSPG